MENSQQTRKENALTIEIKYQPNVQLNKSQFLKTMNNFIIRH